MPGRRTRQGAARRARRLATGLQAVMLPWMLTATRCSGPERLQVVLPTEAGPSHHSRRMRLHLFLSAKTTQDSITKKVHLFPTLLSFQFLSQPSHTFSPISNQSSSCWPPRFRRWLPRSSAGLSRPRPAMYVLPQAYPQIPLGSSLKLCCLALSMRQKGRGESQWLLQNDADVCFRL